MPSLPLSHEAVHLFLRGIQGWLSDRDIPVLSGSEVDGAKRPYDVAPGPAPYMFAPSRRDKAGRKREQAEQLGRDVESGWGGMWRPFMSQMITRMGHMQRRPPGRASQDMVSSLGPCTLKICRLI